MGGKFFLFFIDHQPPAREQRRGEDKRRGGKGIESELQAIDTLLEANSCKK